MFRSLWKVACVVLLCYTVIGGLLMPVPSMYILNETIRNLYFHVPMWFTMMVLFSCGFYYNLKYLRSGKLSDDFRAVEFINVGIFFSILGLVTGMEWASETWGKAWSNDPKQLGTAMCILTYFAYVILRGGIKDEEKRARISSVYAIFAFALMMPLIFILPRMVDSLHPGDGGNPGFNAYDLDNGMRLVFYPAVAGWILLGLWLAQVKTRIRFLHETIENQTQISFNKK